MEDEQDALGRAESETVSTSLEEEKVDYDSVHLVHAHEPALKKRRKARTPSRYREEHNDTALSSRKEQSVSRKDSKQKKPKQTQDRSTNDKLRYKDKKIARLQVINNEMERELTALREKEGSVLVASDKKEEKKQKLK